MMSALARLPRPVYTLLTVLWSCAAAARGPHPAPALDQPAVLVHAYQRLAGGGGDWRLPTPRGVVRVFAPPGYDPRRAGIAVYAHGYGTSAEREWRSSRLPLQFEASRRNALFIVPDGARHAGEALPWPALDSLLAEVARGICAELPRGAVTILAHSSGVRTLAAWLTAPRVHRVVLLDGLHGQEGALSSWLARDPRRKLVLVAARARHQAERWVSTAPGARRLGYVPRLPSELTPEERAAPLLYLRSQYRHAEMVHRPVVISIALQIAAR